MTLDRSFLRSSISHLFKSETMPKGPVPDSVREWVAAYAKYAQFATAGGTIPSKLVPLIGPNGRFFDSLDSSLRSMWSTVIWTGPSLVGMTLVVPPLVPMLESASQLLIKSRDADLALTIITDALHTYTLSITVSVVPPSGIPVVSLLL